MPRIRRIIQLSKTDYSSLTNILSGGESSARRQTRARILDLLHRGKSPVKIAELLRVAPGTIYNVQNRYLAEGLQAALTDKPRSGKPSVISGLEKARLTALACADAPSGHARWTLRLLAAEAVTQGLVSRISHKTVGEILKKTY
jgi:putative transposase